MALIRATCEDCGDIELRSRDLALFTQEVQPQREADFYRFICTICHLTQIKPADEQVVDILTAANVISVPKISYPKSEIADCARFETTSLHDYAIDFNKDLRNKRLLAKYALLDKGQV